MFLLILINILLGLAYIFLNFYLYFVRAKYRHFQSPPLFPSPLWFMGHFLDISVRRKRSPNKNLGQLLAEYHFEYKWDMFRVSFFKDNIVFCSALSSVKRIITDAESFPKSRVMLEAQARINRACGGNRVAGKSNIFTLPGGETWRKKRKAIDSAFKKSFLRNTMGNLNKIANELVESFDSIADEGVHDITTNLNWSSMTAVSVCGFDWDEKLLKEQGQNALDLVTLIFNVTACSIKQPYKFPLPWNFQEEKEKFTKVSLEVRDAMKVHLEKRIKVGKRGDVLSHIIESCCTAGKFDLDDVIDEYTVFLLAGMETTAIALGQVLWLLTNNPEELRKVLDEVDEVFEGKEQEDLTMEDVAKLQCLERVVKESLRMKGPAFGVWKSCAKDGVTVEGARFPKHTKIFIPILLLQNDPRYWDTPDAFKPDRWLGHIEPFSYIPFSGGQRNCIGRHFAMLEMKVIIAKVLRRFKFENPCHGLENPATDGYITVRPLNGIPMKIHRRKSLFNDEIYE